MNFVIVVVVASLQLSAFSLANEDQQINNEEKECF